MIFKFMFVLSCFNKEYYVYKQGIIILKVQKREREKNRRERERDKTKKKRENSERESKKDEK